MATTIRSTWTGDLMIGAVAIGIRVHSATEESGPRMHDAHIKCGGRTGLRRYCKECGEQDLSTSIYQGLGKMVEVDKDTKVFLDSHDLAALRPHIAHEATVIDFVEQDTIPHELYGSFYYLSPDLPASKRSRNTADRPYTAAKAYAVLAEALRRTGKVAVVRIALRQKESLGFIYFEEGVLRLRTLLWANQVRQPEIDNLPVHEEFSARELLTMEALVVAMTGKFDPDAPEYADTYTQRLNALVEERAAA